MLIFLASMALAEVPVDPAPDCSEAAQDLCISDVPDDWDLISWIPESAQGSVRPSELEQGAGIGADRAFRYETGDWDVPIAILDSGIEYNESELIYKVRLNTAELPPPQRADGSEVPDYDLDGNGLVNVADYLEDARVDWAAGPDDGDDWLDSGDLIATFSDGVDDDANGYPDDIAGWDFFNWDNQPWAVPGSTSYHGSSVMRGAAAEGGNGGSIGVCPNCSLLPLRLGDGFITEGDRISLAVTYAVDMGAEVVGMALGGLSVPDHTRAAFQYADARGAVLIGNPGDENSFHRNTPGNIAPAFYMHSIRANTQQEEGDPYTYQAFQNCNNYSPRLDLVASSDLCGTGSVARMSGALGLLKSAGYRAGLELSPIELRGIFQATATDVHFTEEERELARGVPAAEGWDAYFGDGRIDIGEAVEAVLAGDIPPEARITAPRWFSWHDEERIAVEGWVDAPRSEGVSWTLEAGTGLEPQEWASIASGEGAADGLLAEVDPVEMGWGLETFGDLDDEDQFERYERANRPLVTFRLSATDAEGRQMVARRGVWVHRDPDMLPGYPVDLGSSAEASVVLADLDGDAVLEVVAAGSNGQVHALTGSGEELPGFPVQTDVSERVPAEAPWVASGELPALTEGIFSTPAVGDLDGDGQPEIVAGTVRGSVYAWHVDGRRVEGFPVRIDGRANEEFIEDRAWDDGIGAAPSLADVDGDGADEVVVGAMDQRLYVWSGAGNLRDGYPMDLCMQCDEVGARILSSPAIGDIDADGDLDVAIGTNEIPVGDTGLLWVIDLAAAEVWSDYPITRDGLINQSILPVLGEGHPSSVALADLDGDGDLELGSYAMLGTTPPIHHDGSEVVEIGFAADRYGELANFRDGSFMSMVTGPSFGDMDLDGVPDLALGGASVMWVVSLAGSEVVEHDQAFGAWSLATGEMLPGFPRQAEDIAFLAVASIAEISGDPFPEALYGTGGGLVHAWDFLGREPPGWPKFTGGWILGSAAVGDVDGDGYHDAVIANRDGHVFAWSTAGRADLPPQWASMHHDARNRGNLENSLPTQAGPVLDASSSGCCGAGGAGDTAWLLLPGLAWLLRRRRTAGRWAGSQPSAPAAGVPGGASAQNQSAARKEAPPAGLV